MAIKRITASSMSQGLKAIAQQFGDQAVILSNRKVVSGVEIMIEVEDQEPLKSAPAAKSRNANQDEIIKANPLPPSLDSKEIASWLGRLKIDGLPSASAGRAKVAKPSTTTVAASGPSANGSAGLSRILEPQAHQQAEPEFLAPESSKPDPWQMLAELQRSMDELKADLYRQREPSVDRPSWAHESPAAKLSSSVSVSEANLRAEGNKPSHANAKVWQQLLDYGFTQAYLDTEFECAGSTNERMAQWSTKVPSLRHLPEQSSALLFVGPTGAGKTTSLAKLLTQWVMQHGNQGVAVISLDQYRMGAMDSLKTLCKLLNVPFSPVTNDSGLAQAIAAHQGKRLFIDSSGCAEGLAFIREQLLAADALVYQLVCLPASHQHSLLFSYCQNLRRTLGQPDAMILTKLDENPAIGHLLQLAAQLGLPLAYSSSGNKIPDDIEKVRLNSLITKTWRQCLQLYSFNSKAA